MKVELKLDAAAMAALFPEGTQVRLELQQAVINETVRNIIDRNLSGTRSIIDKAVNDQITAALAAVGFSSKLFGTINLSTDAKIEIVGAVKAAYSAEIKAAVDAVALPAIDETRRRLTTLLDDDMRVRLNLLAKEALRGALK